MELGGEVNISIICEWQLICSLSGLKPHLLVYHNALATWQDMKICTADSGRVPQRGHTVSMLGLNLKILSFVGRIFEAILRSIILYLSWIFDFQIKAVEEVSELPWDRFEIFLYAALTECFPLELSTHIQLSFWLLFLTGILLMVLTEFSSNSRFNLSKSQPDLLGANSYDTTRQVSRFSGDLGTGLKFGKSGTQGSSQVRVLSPLFILLHTPGLRILFADSMLFQDQEDFLGDSVHNQFLPTLYLAFKACTRAILLL